MALAAVEWLVGSARNTEAGLTWAATPSDDEVDPTLYSGAAGIVLALLEAQRHFRDDRYGDSALRGARAIAAAVDQEQQCSLYFGLTGMAVALHAVGAASGYRELTELAMAGAADVVARNEAGPAGFLVPHSDPAHKPKLIERYSYGWCNGPTGDAQVFRLLETVTNDPAWSALAERCWRTVTHSGLPQRLRPGFWDNNGRCCGTAGVLALACDRYVELAQSLEFATVLVDDLVAPRVDRCRRCALVQPRTPSHAQRARTADRMGDGQRRHRP